MYSENVLNMDDLYRVDYSTDLYVVYQSLEREVYYIHSIVEGDGFKFLPCKRLCVYDFVSHNSTISLSELKSEINCIIPCDVSDSQAHKYVSCASR